MKKFAVVLMILGLCSFFAYSQDSANAKKAKALVKSAIEFYKANGKDKFLTEVSNSKGKFSEGEWYIFVFDVSSDESAKCIARGDGNLKLIGVNMWEMKDPTGKFYIQEMVKLVKTKKMGWLDYKRSNPKTKKIEPKSSYIELLPDNKDIFLGCGFYK